MAIKALDATFIAGVRDDLAYLRDHWDEPISEHALRRDSNVLRRLLVHGDLQKAWRADGQPMSPLVTVPDHRAMWTPEWRRKTVWASEGGARTRGGAWWGTSLTVAPSTSARPSPMAVPVARYTDGIVAVVMGMSVKRGHVIKYVANKLGGSHYDDRRATKGDEAVYANLDEVAGFAVLNGFPLVYWELLSIGQNLLRSPDLAAWIPGGGLPPLDFVEVHPPEGGPRPASPVITVDEAAPSDDSIPSMRIDQLLGERLFSRLARRYPR